MQIKSIAECSKGSILQYIQPSLRYHKIFVLSIFAWQFNTGFNVYFKVSSHSLKIQRIEPLTLRLLDVVYPLPNIILNMSLT